MITHYFKKSFLRPNNVDSLSFTVSMLVAASSAQTHFLCGCKPYPPICASNLHTYNGICFMNCDRNYTNLYKLYDGPCRLGSQSGFSSIPASRSNDGMQDLLDQQRQQQWNQQWDQQWNQQVQQQD